MHYSFAKQFLFMIVCALNRNNFVIWILQVKVMLSNAIFYILIRSLTQTFPD